MLTKTHSSPQTVFMPVTLPQIAESLRRLSRHDLETLELLLDKKALLVINRSVRDVQRGKVRELTV